MDDPRPAAAAAILAWRDAIPGLAASDKFAAYARILEAGPACRTSPEDAAACAQLLATHGAEPNSFPGVLVRLMYEPPYRIGATVDYAALGPLGLAVLRAAIARPGVFVHDDDAEAHAHFLGQVADRILATARQNPRSPVVEAFILECQFGGTYFAQTSLKTLHEKRSEIARLYLLSHGFQIEASPAPRPSGRRIKLGILCNDCSARTETFVTLPLFRHLDRADFEIWLLSQHRFDIDTHGAAVAACAEHAVVLPRFLKDQVARIRELGLDALVFSTNVTLVQNNPSLLALHRLAPIQIATCCSPTTTGMPTIDFFLSGDLAETAAMPQDLYTETLLRLQGTGLCFDYSLDHAVQPRLDRARLGIPDDAILFASGANMHKIGPQTRRAWARILAETPRSFLVTYPYGSAWGRNYPRRDFEAEMRAALSERGVDAGRVIFLEPLKSRGNVKAVLALADIYLDSFPYGGANTIIDPLELGIPAIAMRGTFQRSQQGAAILDDLGLPDLAAKDVAEYCDLAVFLASKPGFRAAIADRIRQRMREQPRFLDAKNYARQFGTLIRSLVGLEADTGTDDAKAGSG